MDGGGGGGGEGGEGEGGGGGGLESIFKSYCTENTTKLPTLIFSTHLLSQVKKMT